FLDLNNRGITDLHGLDFATNLKTLSISGNLVSDLTPIIPHTITKGDAVGAPVGLSHLEFLALDFDPVSDLTPLHELTALKGISADARPEITIPLPGNGGLLRTISNPVPGAGDLFGGSIAASADFIAVGAPGDSTQLSEAGAVYVFDAT